MECAGDGATSWWSSRKFLDCCFSKRKFEHHESSVHNEVGCWLGIYRNLIFRDGALRVIRPLVMVREKALRSFAEEKSKNSFLGKCSKYLNYRIADCRRKLSRLFQSGHWTSSCEATSCPARAHLPRFVQLAAFCTETTATGRLWHNA